MHTTLRTLKAIVLHDIVATTSIAIALAITGMLFFLERTDTLPLRGQSMPSYGYYMDEWEMERSPIATAKPPRWRSSKVQRRLERRIRWYDAAPTEPSSSSSASSKRVRVRSSISRTH